MISVLWFEAAARAVHRAWISGGELHDAVEPVVGWLVQAACDPANQDFALQLGVIGAVSAYWVAAAVSWARMSPEERLAVVEDGDVPPLW